MNNLTPQQVEDVLDPIVFNDPELGDYWRLIQTVESKGFCEIHDGVLNVWFDISYGKEDNYSLIRIHRMYYPAELNKILVTDFVQDFPPTVQSKAVNFYIGKNDAGKVTVSPYKETTVPNEIINLMKKAGSFSHCEGSRLVIRPLQKQLKAFVLKNGKWQSLLVKH